MKEYILRAFVIILISAPVYAIIRRPWRFKDKREILLGAFVVYLSCLLVFTLEGVYSSPSSMLHSAMVRLQTGDGINLVPFKTISGFFRGSSADSFWINIISNVVIFIPWGFLLPTLWEKFRSIKTLLPMCLAITTLIEVAQLFICRNTDIDDVILNFIGGIIGGVLFILLEKIKSKHKI